MLILDKAEWHKAADVVVVGYGAAGAVAAIAARDHGADVLLLEKQPSETHASTSSMSQGAFLSPPDAKSTLEYLRLLTGVDEGTSWTDLETLRVFAELASENREWMEQFGGELDRRNAIGSHRELPGSELLQLYHFEGRGAGLMAYLKGVVDRYETEVMYGVSTERLIVNHRGEVIGVTARGEGGAQINIKAARGVVLATGGFEFNEAMKLQYLRCHPFHFSGSTANTGDGIRMAAGIGAELWHMNCTAAGLVMKVPENPRGLSPAIRTRAGCGYIIVDRTGRRFTNENYKPHHVNYELALYDSRALSYPRIPCFWIMDHRRIADGPLTSTEMARSYAEWSEDNSREIEMGWIRRADTVRELGRQLGIDADNLQKTVQNYNSYCRNNADLEFRRRPQSLIPLDTPPFYGVSLWPGGSNTLGGPRHNYKSQVMNVDGEPVPGLYAAGEMGSNFGMLYEGGGNLAECISFGRLAGENAAKEKPRSVA